MTKLLSERAKTARKHRDINQSQAAKIIGVSREAISQWENGKTKTINSEILHKAASAYGVNAHWLATGKGEMTSNVETAEQKPQDVILWDDVTDLPENEFVLIPYLDINAACGYGCVNEDHPDTKCKLAFRTDFIKSSKATSTDLKVLKAKGDSMMPTIFDGDTLLVDLQQNTIQNGNVYAFVVDNELKVKRLSLENEEIKAHSDNQADPRYRYDESFNPKKEQVKIVGRIVHRSGSSGL